jgi:hypothetical protein
MKKKPTSQSAFLNLRGLVGLFVSLAGVFLALLSFGPATTGFAQGTTRAEMTLALAQALAINPPACVAGQEIFNDVPASSPFCPFIEELARRGITGGCGGGNFCPGNPVSRQQMAVFIIKATEAFHVVGDNTAAGTQALQSLTTGVNNSGLGFQALFSNTSGSHNTAIGYGALERNNTFGFNTATGYLALNDNTGSTNTATGAQALENNTTGSGNTAVGYIALSNNMTSNFNTALGFGACASVTASGNVCIGQGVFGEPGAGNTTWICNVNTLTQNFSAGVNNYVTVRLSDGRLGNTAVVSSRRYKEDIKPLDRTSDALYALKPVSFHLKKQHDETQALSFGLIAEEVEKVDPDLVYRNDKGQVESVRYEMVNAMLLNEFLKEHKKVQKLETTIVEQQSKLVEQERQIEALTSGLQKVSAQLELNKPTTRMARNKTD